MYLGEPVVRMCLNAVHHGILVLSDNEMIRKLFRLICAINKTNNNASDRGGIKM